MDDLGDILAESKITQVGPRFVREYVNFRWVGPPVAAVVFSLVEQDWRNVERGSTITVGPFRVQVIDINPQGYYEVRRVDQYGAKSLLLAVLIRSKRQARNIYERLIMTMAIWGLAKWEPAERPNKRWITQRWRREKHNG